MRVRRAREGHAGHAVKDVPGRRGTLPEALVPLALKAPSTGRVLTLVPAPHQLPFEFPPRTMGYSCELSDVAHVGGRLTTCQWVVRPVVLITRRKRLVTRRIASELQTRRKRVSHALRRGLRRGSACVCAQNRNPEGVAGDFDSFGESLKFVIAAMFRVEWVATYYVMQRVWVQVPRTFPQRSHRTASHRIGVERFGRPVAALFCVRCATFKSSPPGGVRAHPHSAHTHTGMRARVRARTAPVHSPRLQAVALVYIWLLIIMGSFFLMNLAAAVICKFVSLHWRLPTMAPTRMRARTHTHTHGRNLRIPLQVLQ